MKDRHFFFALGLLLALALASTAVVVVVVVMAPRLLDARQLLGTFVSDGRAVAAPPLLFVILPPLRPCG